MNAIFKRASVRSFKGLKVEKQQIEDLMKAAMAAPSAGNQQPWEFFIATDEKLKKKLSETSPYAGPAEGAAAVIVVCRHLDGLRFAGCVDQDLSACIENILLEAVELGLGAVWMGIAPDQERMKAVMAHIGSPSGIEPFALVAIGYPEGETVPRGMSRYNPDRIHWL